MKQIGEKMSMTMSPQTSSRNLLQEFGVSQIYIVRINKELRLKVCRQRLLHQLHEDDSDRRMQFSEEFIYFFQLQRCHLN